MASMFKKPRRNFRKKLDSGDSDDENNDSSRHKSRETSKDPAVMTVAELKKSREKKKKEKADISSQEKVLPVLSFGDNEEEEESEDAFHIKKSSHSRKVVKELKKKVQQEKEDSKEKDTKEKTNTQVSGAGEYSSDRLKELKGKQKTTNGRPKPSSPPPPLEDSKFDAPAEPRKQTHDPFSSVLQTGLIPDANTIHEIRKKRQQARERGDFIPVDDTVKVDSAKSRLIREDENDMSDDDERINFTVNTQAIERQKLRDGFLAAEQGSDKEGESDQDAEWENQQIRSDKEGESDQDAEWENQQIRSDKEGESDQDDEWENQQIRKGVNSQQVSTLVQGLKDQYIHTPPPQLVQTPQPLKRFPSPSSLTAGASGTTNLSELSLEFVKKNIQERVQSMQSVHRDHQTQLAALKTDTLTTEGDVTTGQSSTQSLEARYKFFQETRGYIRDVLACLNDKAPRISKLESRVTNMWKNRATKLSLRRQQDTRDQCQDYSSTGKLITDKPDPIRQQRAADREARRARRRRTREKKMIIGHHEGLSSDDEETPSEISKYRSDSDLIQAEIGGVFDDAVEDYYEIPEIRAKFEEWKFRYNDSYTEAYIGLCLSKLLNPLIRLQLVTWNPLEEGHKELEEFPWYRDIALMGHQMGIVVEREDDDTRTIPIVVDKIVMQKLTEIATNVWDPLSTTQTCRLVNLVQKLVTDYPTVDINSKHIQTLLKAVVTRIKKTLNEDIFMPIYPKSVIENKTDDASVFFNRQFWTCVKLLGNILSWYGIIEDTILQQLSLDSLLNRYIVLGLQSCGANDDLIKRCHTIVSTLPKPWFNNLDTKQTMPQLENMCRYLDYAAGVMGDLKYDMTDMQRKLARERVKQIVKLLTNMAALDHAAHLCDRFSVKL